MPAEERAGWLASLRESNPELASMVEALLDEHRFWRKSIFSNTVLLNCQSRCWLGKASHLYPDLRHWPRWHGQRLAGPAQRWTFRTQGSGQVAESGTHGARRRGTLQTGGPNTRPLNHPHIAELLDAGVSSGGQAVSYS